MLICVVSRAPLLPIGSLTTCTTISWPSRSNSLIGGTGCGCDGGASSSPAISGVGSERITSLACRNAARSRPISTNAARSEEHTSELQSLMRISYAVFCLKKKTAHIDKHHRRLHSELDKD